MTRLITNFFVSYAHKNQQLAGDFLDRLTDVLRPSRKYDYHLWNDSAIAVGETWKTEILAACDGCDIGMLLISPAFLGSKFIVEHELPNFVGSGSTKLVPVMLQPVDFELHQLHGIENTKIFMYKGQNFSKYRAYGECKGGTRDAFVLALFKAIEEKLAASISKIS